MSRFSIALFTGLIAASCGGAPEPAPSPPAAQSAAVTRQAAAPQVKVPPLAIALEGNVTRKSETEYQATGPEILCSAFLMDSDVPRLVSSDVKWMTDPPGGTFSFGASGVFFLPDKGSTVKIYAVLEEDSGPSAVSPKLTLLVP